MPFSTIFGWHPVPKDTGHSCIFEYPDGPPNPTPPPPVPTDPPDCYPYCNSDDWPPPSYVPPPITPPVGTVVSGAGFVNCSSSLASVASLIGEPITFNCYLTGLGYFTLPDNDIGNYNIITYHGAGGISTDFILELESTRSLLGFGTKTRSAFVNIGKLLATFSDPVFLFQVAGTAPQGQGNSDNANFPDSIYYYASPGVTPVISFLFQFFIYRDTHIASYVLVNGVQHTPTPP